MTHLGMDSPSAAQPSNPTPTAIDGWYARALFGLVLALAVAVALRPIGPDADAWDHAAIGRWIWTHGELPPATLFLWSARQPWIDHSWLSQLGFYALLAGGGSWLIVGLNVGMVTLLFGTVWHFWNGKGRVTALTAALFAIAILASYRRFHARPEEFTALFLVWLLIFLLKWRDRPLDSTPAVLWRKPSAWGLVAMFVLWANCHGAVVIGGLIIAVTAGLDFGQEKGSPRSRTLAGLALACVLAINFNPYGWRLWLALAPLHSFIFQWIDEWKPFWKDPVLAPDILAGQVAVWFVALFAWIRGERRWASLAWLLLLGAMFCLARRNAFLCALTSLLVLAENARYLVPEALMGKAGAQIRVPRLIRPVVLAALLFLVLKNIPWGMDRAAEVPVRFADYLATLPADTRLFNHYNESPYLEWRLNGKPLLFVDAVNAYPDAVLENYLDVVYLTPHGRALIENNNFNVIAMAKPGPLDATPALFAYLENSPNWVVSFEDQTSIAWTRVKGGGH